MTLFYFCFFFFLELSGKFIPHAPHSSLLFFLPPPQPRGSSILLHGITTSLARQHERLSLCTKSLVIVFLGHRWICFINSVPFYISTYCAVPFIAPVVQLVQKAHLEAPTTTRPSICRGLLPVDCCSPHAPTCWLRHKLPCLRNWPPGFGSTPRMLPPHQKDQTGNHRTATPRPDF